MFLERGGHGETGDSVLCSLGISCLTFKRSTRERMLGQHAPSSQLRYLYITLNFKIVARHESEVGLETHEELMLLF